MLKVWGRKSSSNVQAVMWSIAELGLDHERIDAGLTYGVTDTPEYLAMNPNGTIPTIRDVDHPPLWESCAIIRYLARTYGSDPFSPTDYVQWAQADQWAEWSKVNIASKFTAPIFWKVVRTAPSKRDPDAIAEGIRYLSMYLEIANSRLSESDFLAGPDFTFADIIFGHCLYRYYDIDIERPEHAHVRRYYDALCRRPAYRDHVMVSYEELRVHD